MRDFEKLREEVCELEHIQFAIVGSLVIKELVTDIKEWEQLSFSVAKVSIDFWEIGEEYWDEFDSKKSLAALEGKEDKIDSMIDACHKNIVGIKGRMKVVYGKILTDDIIMRIEKSLTKDDWKHIRQMRRKYENDVIESRKGNRPLEEVNC